jgi:hypothetical protein
MENRVGCIFLGEAIEPMTVNKAEYGDILRAFLLLFDSYSSGTFQWPEFGPLLSAGQRICSRRTTCTCNYRQLKSKTISLICILPTSIPYFL